MRGRAGATFTAATAILVADTSVVLGGAILGKPSSEAEALGMIEGLSGVTHDVQTRFALGEGDRQRAAARGLRRW